MPDAVRIFIAPPSEETLRTRLVGRGTDDAEQIERAPAGGQGRARRLRRVRARRPQRPPRRRRGPAPADRLERFALTLRRPPGVRPSGRNSDAQNVSGADRDRDGAARHAGARARPRPRLRPAAGGRLHRRHRRRRARRRVLCVRHQSERDDLPRGHRLPRSQSSPSGSRRRPATTAAGSRSTARAACSSPAARPPRSASSTAAARCSRSLRPAPPGPTSTTSGSGPSERCGRSAPYVTDSSLPVIWRVSNRVRPLDASTASSTSRDDRLHAVADRLRPRRDHALGRNGRYLLTTQGTTGQLWRIDLWTRRISEVDLGGAGVLNADGIVLRGSHAVRGAELLAPDLQAASFGRHFERGRVVKRCMPTPSGPHVHHRQAGRADAARRRLQVRLPGRPRRSPRTGSWQSIRSEVYSALFLHWEERADGRTDQASSADGDGGGRECGRARQDEGRLRRAAGTAGTATTATATGRSGSRRR